MFWLVFGFVFAASLITSGYKLAVVGGIIILVLSFYPVFVKIKYPVVACGSGSVAVWDYLGRRKEFHDLSNRDLVVSNTFLAFRLNGHDEIILNKDEISNARWIELVLCLKEVEFHGIIEGEVSSKNV